MQRSFCINIPMPPPRKGVDKLSYPEFLFIDEDRIIHPAGRSLQITSISPPTSSSEEVKTTSVGCTNQVPDDEHIHQGFSCYCFNRRLRRIAYSRKTTTPSIFVWSYQKSKMLCKIDSGASFEYAHISFNVLGTKLVAIGRGEIDASVFVWTLTKQNESHEIQSILPFTSNLLVKHKLSYAVTECFFNPIDDNKIALLHENRGTVSFCKLSDLGGRVELQDEPFCTEQEKSANNEGQYISAWTWEEHNKLLIGMSDGSIRVLLESGGEQTIWTPHEGMACGGVCGIIVLSKYLLVGFRRGRIVLVDRTESNQTWQVVDVYKEVLLEDNIVTFDCDPSYERVLVLTREGNLYSFPIDKTIQDDPTYRHTKITEVHHSLVPSLCQVTLTGRASVTIILSGGLDGKIKAFKDVPINGTRSRLSSALVTLNLDTPVTALETLIGNPVCAVGSSDGCLRFLHVGKSTEHKELFGYGSINLVILKSEVLTDAPITSIKYNKQTKKLVVCCYKSGQAFVVCAEPTNLHVLGVVETADKSPLCSASWSNVTDFRLFIGSTNGSLACFDTTTMCFSAEPLKPVWETNIEIQRIKEIIVHEQRDRCFVYVAHSQRNGFDSFILNNEDSGNVKIQLNQTFEIFNKIISFMSIRESYLMVASMSGEVALFEYTRDGNLEQKALQCVHSCPVLSMTLNSNSSHVYSSSIDGAVCVSHIIGSIHPIIPSAYEYDYLVRCNCFSNHLY